ncbi:unnamed protein product, partial [Dibothriocephalus latus]
MARPSISSDFIDKVSNMSFCENSETAIIQVDPSNAITYDALRLWRFVLSEKGALASAARCTYVMAALPAGQGFNISSFILESKTHVSLASAVALAVRLTYVNFVEGAYVLPINKSFFGPLTRGLFAVPVLPNVTYKFSNNDGKTIEFYDFYVFTFKPEIFVGGTNVGALDFEKIFELNSVLLYPKGTFATVNIKVWPKPGRGPQRNY